MAHSRRAQPDTELDVNLIILDYLLFMATKSVLEEQEIRLEEGVEENLSGYPLQMVDCRLNSGLVSLAQTNPANSLFTHLQTKPPQRGCAKQYSLPSATCEIHNSIQPPIKPARDYTTAIRAASPAPDPQTARGRMVGYSTRFSILWQPRV